MPYVTKKVYSFWADGYINKTVWEGPRPMKYYAWSIIGWTLGLGALAAAIWALVFGLSNHQNGVYAGYYYGDALNRVQQVLAHKYGLLQAEQMRFGKPDVVNTHLGPKGGVFRSPQVRIFHLIGPKGVHYCIWLWHHNSAENKRIIKGCKFQ